MNRKRQQSTQTITCSGCGTKNVVLSSESPARSTPWINIVPRPMSDEEIAAIAIPFKHALHLAVPTGFFVAVCFALDNPSLTPQARALGGGLAVACFTFVSVRALAAVKNWEHLGWKLEQMFNIDLINRDGIIGEPPPEAHAITTSITVQERAPNGKINRIRHLAWPCKPDEIEPIARRLLSGELALTDWGKGKLKSVPKFKAIRKSLIDAGYGKWKSNRDHTLGWELTPSGRVFLGARPTAPTKEPGRTNPPTPPEHS